MTSTYFALVVQVAILYYESWAHHMVQEQSIAADTWTRELFTIEMNINIAITTSIFWLLLLFESNHHIVDLFLLLHGEQMLKVYTSTLVLDVLRDYKPCPSYYREIITCIRKAAATSSSFWQMLSLEMLALNYKVHEFVTNFYKHCIIYAAAIICGLLILEFWFFGWKRFSLYR